MKPTRILHVIRPAEGGMKEHLTSLAAGLKQRGYVIEVACPGNTPLAAETAQLGLKVHPIDLVGPLNPGSDLQCIRQLHNILRQGQYDIIHFHGAKAGLVGRAAAVTAGCRNTVLTVHNFIIYEEVPLAKKIIFKYGEQLLSRVTSKIITVSQALKDDLIANYKIAPDKLIPIYNGIDTSKYKDNPVNHSDRAQYGIISGTEVVGTVARMAPQKGLNYLIEAAAVISQTSPEKAREITFIIAGDGPLRSELEDLAGRLGVRDKVLFPGYVQNIPGLLSCLDIFVIPSIAEGLSITTIEAMAAGLPVVASRVGGLPELVRQGETGFLVEPRDPRGLADALLRLLADREARRQLGHNGRLLATQQFSSESMVDQTCRVYEDILMRGA